MGVGDPTDLVGYGGIIYEAGDEDGEEYAPITIVEMDENGDPVMEDGVFPVQDIDQ